MPGLNFKGTNKYQKIAESMLKKTHFTESEIDRLSDLHANILVRMILCLHDKTLMIFQRCNNHRGKIDRKKFREFLHDKLDMTEDIIMDRIFKYFNTECQDDIDLEEWITGFNVILKGI